MPYRLKRKESIAAGFRRIAREEARKALDASTGDGPVDERIHDARTRCKKLRGLLRLIRPHFGGFYRRENAFLRDAARSLSIARDAAVVQKAFGDLARRDRLQGKVFEAVRAALPTTAGPAGDDAARLTAFAESMRPFLSRLNEFEFDADGFRAIADGLTETYRDGRRAMSKALDGGADAERHGWRKQVKYHWHHVRLLRNVWQPLMEARGEELSRLGDLLGDDHDLAVLSQIIDEASALEPGDGESFKASIDRRRPSCSRRPARWESDCTRRSPAHSRGGCGGIGRRDGPGRRTRSRRSGPQRSPRRNTRQSPVVAAAAFNTIGNTEPPARSVARRMCPLRRKVGHVGTT